MPTAAKKITVEVPEELLARATRVSKAGVTATVRRGLELVAAENAFRGIRSLRAKVNLKIDLDRLRED